MNQSVNHDPGFSRRIERLESVLASGSGADEVDLRTLVGVFWRARWLIAGFTTMVAVASVLFALWLPDQYRATAILAPASSARSSALGEMAARFGGLASLAGINLEADAETDKTAVAMALLRTWGFLDDFIRQNNIEVEVFAAIGWDRSRNELIVDPDLYDIEQKQWVRRFDPGQGETAEPSSWELYDAFVDRVSVAQDEQTGLVTLGVEYYSPFLAKEWADKLIANINKHLQERDRLEAIRSIEYLNKQAEQTSITELRNVFYSLIQEQTKDLVLAEVSEEYVLQTLSAARVPEEKSRPRRALICIFATVAGLVLSMLFVVANYGFRADGAASAAE